MVLINWEQIKNINLNDIQEEEVDDVYKQLADLNIQDESDLEKLRMLFNLSQVVMQTKVLQAEVAMEELDKLAESQGTASGKIVQRLMNENEDLKQQIQYLERFTSGHGAEKISRNGTQEAKRIHDEVQNLRRDNERLRLELQTTEKNLEKEKLQTEKYIARLEETEREKREDRREIENLRDEIQEYRHRMDSQTESTTHREQHLNSTNKIKDKNRQISKLLEEIEVLEKSNEEYQTNIVNLRSKLEDATRQMEITTEEYLSQKTELSNSLDVVEDLRKQNFDLKNKLEDVITTNREKEDNEEKIIAVFNKKIEDWKVVIGKKDKELSQCHQRIKELEHKFSSDRISNEGATVNNFTKALLERDKRIELLTKQLSKATLDFDLTTKILEGIKLPQPGSQQSNLHSVETKYINQINQLQSVLQEKNHLVSQTNQLLIETEAHAASKDKELISTLSRLREYETGEYGLAEAVAEIKDLKLQLKKRDEKVENLTMVVNKKDIEFGELVDENEELRTKLGLDPKIPLSKEEVAQNSLSRRLKERSLNFELQQEIEKLEEERIQMKMEIRKLSQLAGLRSAKLGSLEKDLITNIDTLPDRRRKYPSFPESEEIERNQKDEIIHLQDKNSKLEEQLKESNEQLQMILQENSKLRQLSKEAIADVQHLEDGLKDVLDALKQKSATSTVFLQCPSLEKLITLIEAKRLTGSYDRAVVIKSQLDLERGRNEELRQELQRYRRDSGGHKIPERRNVIENNIQSQIKLEDNRQFPMLSFPENMTLSSSATIAILNTQLVDVLDAFDKKNKNCEELTNLLDNYRKKVEVIRQQQGLLYEEFASTQKNWNQEKHKLNEEKEKLVDRNDELEIKLQEFEKMATILSRDESEIRRRIAEMSGHLATAKTNERYYRRKTDILIRDDADLRKELSKMESEMVEMSKKTQQRVNFLEQFKETATSKISLLQQELDNSVSQSVFTDLEQQLEDITFKYRNVLQRIADSAEVQVDIPQQYLENQKIESERVHLDQGANQENNKSFLENQLHNAIRRADYAENLFKQEQEVSKQIKQQNKDLQQKIEEMTEIFFENAKTEKNLQQELINSVAGSVHQQTSQRLMDLESREFLLKSEIEKQKSIADIACKQVAFLKVKLDCRDNVTESLRQRVLHFESNSDEKMEIGKLHRELVTIKNELLVTKNSLQASQSKLKEIESYNFHLEKKCNEKEENIFNVNNINRRRVQLLQSALQIAQQKRVGIMSLKSQETLANMILELKNDRAKSIAELRNMKNGSHEVQQKLSECSSILQTIQELAANIKRGETNLQMASWNEENNQLRLREANLSRENIRLEEKINRKDADISKLEKELLRLADECDKNRAQLEQQKLQFQSQTISDDKKQNLTAVDNQSKTAILQLQNENRKLRKELLHLQSTLENRDKFISELQTKIKIADSKSQLIVPEIPSRDDDFRHGLELRHGLDVLQAHISTLQARLSQKEESIAGYCKLLQDARNELIESEQRHQVTLQTLQTKLHHKNDLTLEKFKEIVRQASEKCRSPPEKLRDQSFHIQKLEETVDEQDIALRNLSEKLKESQQQEENYKHQLEIINKEKVNEIERLMEEYNTNIGNLSKELRQKEFEIENSKETVKKLEDEILVQKAENEKSPSVVHQKLMYKLKEEVDTKEKQIQSLSRAVTELKSEMLKMAQENIGKTDAEINSEHQHINDLERKINQLEALNSKLQKDKLSAETELLQVKKENLKVKRVKEDAKSSSISNLSSRSKGVRSFESKSKASERNNSQELIRWEEKKKCQKIIDTMKQKVTEEKKIAEELEKKIKLQRCIIERLENEKKYLEKQVKVERDKRFSGSQHDKETKETELHEELNYLNDENLILKEKIMELEEALSKIQGSEDIEEHNLHTEIINKLKLDINNLENELTASRLSLASENERVDSLRKATDKVLLENQKLTKDLKKIQKENQILRQKEYEMKTEIENLRRESEPRKI